MAKKSNINIPGIAVIRTIVFLFIALVVFSAYAKTVDFLTTSPLFAVKDVLVDASIRFIDARDLRGLKGHNIFKVDVRKVHSRLSAQYPQIAQLRVIRQFPDKIKVLAKKRDVAAQVRRRNKFLLVDTAGVALYNADTQQPSLPVVNGIVLRPRVVLGAPVVSRSLRAVVAILNEFKGHPRTALLKITAVDAANPSKIEFILDGGLRVILDQDHFPLKVQKFEVLLAQRNVEWARARYVDLRFAEPIIAGTDEERTK